MSVLPPTNSEMLFQSAVALLATAVSCSCLAGVPRSRLFRWAFLLVGNYPIISWNIWLAVTILGASESGGWFLPFLNGGNDGIVRLLSMNGGSTAVSDYEITWSFAAARWIGFIGIILFLTAIIMEGWRVMPHRKQEGVRGR